MSVSNNSGNLESTYHQDAFGNVLASWQSGQWASDSASAGWHHNTKELDGDIGLTYMYQRWYFPEIGTFTSSSPLPNFVEHSYSAFLGQPLSSVDPQGLKDYVAEFGGHFTPWEEEFYGNMKAGEMANAMLCFAEGRAAGQRFEPNEGGNHDLENALRHCTWQCCLASLMDPYTAAVAGSAHEEGQDPNDPDHRADVENNIKGRALLLRHKISLRFRFL